jgi:phosphoadenosine phosphosulfate reductase
MEKKVIHSLNVIAEALDNYKNIALFSSFGKDSIVTLHLTRRINPSIKVVSIMTPYKFQETRNYKDYITKLWKLNIATYEAPLVTASNEKRNLYEENVERCCNYYKVEPTKQAIKDLQLDAWISGLRNTEGHTRQFTEEIEVKDGLVKINPILKWTEAEVWLYHAMNAIPPHPLYYKGYRSLGCEPCSLPYQPTERGGRWKGTDKECGECGIHSKSLVSQDAMPKLDVYDIPKRDKGKF